LIFPPEPYQAPRWLYGGHAQTIYPALFLRGKRPRYRRERWDTPDGDFIDLDFLDGGAAGGAFPGNLDWLPRRLLAFFGEHSRPLR
jgi:predicted alpha/beta-fold hydrolase